MKLIVFNTENVDQWEMFVPENIHGKDLVDYLYKHFDKANHLQPLLQEIQEPTIEQHKVSIH